MVLTAGYPVEVEMFWGEKKQAFLYILLKKNIVAVMSLKSV